MKKSRVLIMVLIAIIVIVALFFKGVFHDSKINYDIYDVTEYKYLKYKNGENYGIIDRNGKTIIEAIYKKIIIPNPEKDIFVCYENEEKSKVLNSKNESLFEEYDKVEPIKLKNIASTLCYEKTVLKYKKDEKYGLIDFSGKKITSNVYDSIENLQSTEGKFLVNKNEKFGVINLKGAIIIDTKYDQIKADGYYNENSKSLKAGFIISQTTNDGYRYGYINYEGKKFLNIEYSEIIRIENKEEVYLIAAKKGQYGLYKENKQLIKPEYQSIIYTENGALIIEKHEKFGIANLKGETKVEPKYTKIEEDGIYLYAQNQDENCVYDSDGNKKEMSFSKSIYKTENDDYRITTLVNNDITYYGIENSQGTKLADNEYSYIEYAFEDYFIVEDKNEKYGVINANDKKIIEIKYDLIQKIRNKNMIQVLNRKNNKTKVYSSVLEEVVSMKDASIQNEDNYIKIYNKNEEKYLDKDGNIIDSESEIVKNNLKRKLPEKIGEYKKQQISLDDVYYEKK